MSLLSFRTRLMVAADWDEVARLIHQSLNVWYEKNRGFKLVSGSWETMRVFPRVYESLDPNCCVLVEETNSNRIAGSCFFHPRPRHVSLGILNTHPDFFGNGVASLLLRYVIDFAEQQNKPLRLVSGATNVDSFSLYNKAGFVPTCFYQDMIFSVPVNGFAVDIPSGMEIRDAAESDIPAIVRLELELTGIEREQDYRYFLKNKDGIWHVSVLFGSSGQLDGVLVSVNDPGSNMLGPGVVRTEEQGIELIRFELNKHRGYSPVGLIPSRCRTLVNAMYALGAKNCDLHISQVRGTEFPQTGIAFPTFMPETG
ncbi:MAG: GNAT family N-acetyltransferase [Planctomycetaceae bacterium]|nr:GNAT family N-acetyltransferase [Planctomycetaceae bacterium]